MPLLEVQGLTRRFGGPTGVDSLSFAVEAGEIRGQIWFADDAYVFETGAVVLEGQATRLHENDHVRRADLGG